MSKQRNAILYVGWHRTTPVNVKVTHEVRRVPFYELVYFFDASGLEIGYWSILDEYNDNRSTVFSPRRVWGQQFLDLCAFRTLVTTSEMQTN